MVWPRVHLLPIVTAGDHAEALGPRGVSGDISDLLWPQLHGGDYTDSHELAPNIAPGVLGYSDHVADRYAP